MGGSVVFHGEGYFSDAAARVSSALAKSKGGLSVRDVLEAVCPSYDGRFVLEVLDRERDRCDDFNTHDGLPGFVDLTREVRGGGYYGFDSGYPVINCYPGVPAKFCAQEAVFISLQGETAKGRGHYTFAQALEKMIQHLQGVCSGKTRMVALMANSWNYDQYTQWIGNVNKIRESGVSIEFYLLSGRGQVARLHI